MNLTIALPLLTNKGFNIILKDSLVRFINIIGELKIEILMWIKNDE